MLGMRNAEFRTVERVFPQIHMLCIHLHSLHTDIAILFPKPRNRLPNTLRIESLTFTKVIQVPEEYLPPPPPGSVVHDHTGLFSTPRMAAQLHPGPVHLPYLSRNRPSLICVPKQDRTRSSIPRGQGSFVSWAPCQLSCSMLYDTTLLLELRRTIWKWRQPDPAYAT